MAQTPSPAPGTRTRRSPVDTLLEGHPGDQPLRARKVGGPTTPAPADAAIATAAAPGPTTGQPLPAVQDVALGLLSLLAEHVQRAGTRALGAGRSVLVRWVSLVRSVSPTVATGRVDASIYALAERGRRVRLEGGETLSATVNAAFLSTVTSDAARQLTVAAIERATEDVIAVVMPAMLEALREEETEAALDEMMAGLLVRQLPTAMEKTLPALLMRTATRPTQLMPFLGGVLPRP